MENIPEVPNSGSIDAPSVRVSNIQKDLDQAAARLTQGLEEMILDINLPLPIIIPEVEQIKPDGSPKAMLKPETSGGLKALCEINNIPQLRSEPVRVYSRIDVELDKESFYGDRILDDNSRTDLRGVNLSKALKDHAERYGVETYYYKHLFAENNDLSNLFLYPKLESEQLLELLISNGLYYFSYSQNQAAITFREKYLGWYANPDPQSGMLNYGSGYAPEEIDNQIRSNPGIIQVLNSELKQNLEKRINRITISYDDERNLLGNELYDQKDKILADLNMLNILSAYLMRADFTEESQLITIKYDHKTGTDPAVINILKSVDPFTDDQIENYLSGGFVDQYEQLVGKLQIAYDLITKTIIPKYGLTWNIKSDEFIQGNGNLQYKITNFKVNGLFMELIGRIKSHTIQLQEEFRPKFEKYDARLQEKLSDKENAIQSLAMTKSGAVIDEVINRLSAHFSTTTERKKMLDNSFNPLLLSQKKGAYDEAPAEGFEIVPVPENRLGSLNQQRPEVGLISEYNMEVKHLRFGYGKHLYSQSLFPGEEVSIEMSSKSSKQVEITTNSSEKIFEDANSETSTDFNKELNHELGKTNDSSKKSQTNASISLEASGFGVSVSGSLSKNTESSQHVNEVAKNVANTTDKLARKLSDQRQVTFDRTSLEKVLTTLEEEEKTTRKFVNSNKDRTLTFNFFQITREYLNTFSLQDILFYYTSGRYRVACMFVPAHIYDLSKEMLEDQQASNPGIIPLVQAINKLDKEGYTWNMLRDQKIIRKIPGEVADYFSRDSIVILYEPPYQEIMPLAVTNFFLAKRFDKESNSIFEINNHIWNYIGGGVISPEGLSIAAFPLTKTEMEKWPQSGDKAADETTVFGSTKKIVADTVNIKGIGNKTYTILLPNIDLCYQSVQHFRAKYLAEGERFCLPLPIFQKKYVINTEGVYCENMLGSCGALEEFATKHRDMDLITKQYTNEQERLAIPPDSKNFLGDDGKIDFASYGKAVELYERSIRAFKGFAANETKNEVVN